MNYDLFNSPHINPENFCIIKQLITSTLGDLCKSLQNNPTFQKLYRKNTPPTPNPASTHPHKPCGCQGKTDTQPQEAKTNE